MLYKSEIYEWILQNTTNLRFAKYDHYGEKYVSARSYDTVCVKHLPPILNNFLYFEFQQNFAEVYLKHFALKMNFRDKGVKIRIEL